MPKNIAFKNLSDGEKYYRLIHRRYSGILFSEPDKSKIFMKISATHAVCIFGNEIPIRVGAFELIQTKG